MRHETDSVKPSGVSVSPHYYSGDTGKILVQYPSVPFSLLPLDFPAAYSDVPRCITRILKLTIIVQESS